MIRFLKKYFIPHKDNDHQPHILRTEAALAILGVVLIIEILFLAEFAFFGRTDFLATILPSVLTDQTNENREIAALPKLIENQVLVEAATLKAQDMVAKGYFAHTSPEGITPWYWLQKVGYDFSMAGENLAVNFIDSSDVTHAWMDSPTHRANILNGHFTEIGIGAANGMHRGQEGIFIVEFFGRPTLVNAARTAPVADMPDPKDQISVPLPDDEINEPEPLAQESFVVKGAEVGLESETNNPSDDQSRTTGYASLASRLFASPRAASNFLYLVFFTILAVALVLKILIKIDIQYPRLITHGVLLIIFIASLLLINQYIALSVASVI